MAVSDKKKDYLEKRMQLLGIKEEDLEEKFILSSGKGGQKVQKTASCVYLKHKPSNLEVKCGADRSREINRYKARNLLCDKLEEMTSPKSSKRFKAAEKIRKQKKRRKRRSDLGD